LPRTALAVSYNGHAYHGWQYQGESIDSVQKTLTRAVSTVADTPVTLFCAGRTDTGVHATKQIVHFDCDNVRPDKAWVMGVNAHLPDDVAVQWAGSVEAHFDARRTATARRYLYVIHNVKVRTALTPELLTHEHRRLDETRMNEAAQHLLGEQDFSSFRAANCQSVSPMRNVLSVEVRRRNDLVMIDISANAFLHHMVRNIAGVLMDVGAGEQDPAWVKELMQLRDRSQGGITAAPNGLFLIDVLYPQTSGIPEDASLPHFLQLGQP
jgi:tRNA pseudouridine38-40 synthase